MRGKLLMKQVAAAPERRKFELLMDEELEQEDKGLLYLGHRITLSHTLSM